MQLTRRTFLALPLLLSMRTTWGQQAPDSPSSLHVTQPQLPTPPLRYRYAYPGIEYAVPIAARVVLPVTYTIRSPKNATVDDKGILRFVAPSSGTVTVDLTMVDARGDSADLAWKVTVDASRFVFVDSSLSSAGNGSISSPFKSLDDVWPNTALKDKFVYLRAGTYLIPESTTWSHPSAAGYVLVESDHIAGVLGYPGESVTIDHQTAIGYVGWTPGRDDMFFHNFTCINTTGRAFMLDLTSDNLIVAEITDTTTKANHRDNSAWLQSLNDILWDNGSQGTELPPLGTGSQWKRHVVMQGCTITTDGGGTGMYGMYDYAIMYNDITSSGGQCIGGKSTSSVITVVGNKLWMTGNGRPIFINAQYYSDDWFIANNNIKAPYEIKLGEYTKGPENVVFLRNTLNCRITHGPYDVGGGPVIYDKNVIVNDDPDHIADSPSEYWMIKANVSDIRDNLMGSPKDNIVDANNLLTDHNLLGQYGFEYSPPPKEPSNISISFRKNTNYNSA